MDRFVFSMDSHVVEPGGDMYSRLVYACTSSDVEHVLVDGELVVKHGVHQRLDRGAVLAKARTEAKKLASRADL